MRLLETWRVERAFRQAGPAPTRGDSASTAATGQEWVERLCRRHGLDGDDLVAIHRDICESTTPNLLALGLPRLETVEAAIAAGFTNGLALGLAAR